jgi:hypothetical protein
MALKCNVMGIHSYLQWNDFGASDELKDINHLLYFVDDRGIWWENIKKIDDFLIIKI